MIILRQAQQSDVLAMRNRFRRADVDELLLSHLVDPEEALREGILRSQVALTGFYDGRPIAIAGLNRPWVLSDKGVPWMVGTVDLERPELRRDFLRASRQVLDAFKGMSPKMENWVYTGNRLAIHWLRWLGFTLHAPERYGVSGALFHRFTMGV